MDKPTGKHGPKSYCHGLKRHSKQATQKMKKNVFEDLRREAPGLSIWLVILLGCRFARHQLILAVLHTRSQTQ